MRKAWENVYGRFFLILSLGILVTIVLGALLPGDPQPEPVLCWVRNETEENIFVHVEGDPPFPTQIFPKAEQRITTNRERTKVRIIRITDWEGRSIRRAEVDSIPLRDGTKNRFIAITNSDRIKAGLR